jgi:hypothetical protein
VVVTDFSQTSLSEDMNVAKLGGFAVDCDHGGSHCGAPPEAIAAQWQLRKLTATTSSMTLASISKTVCRYVVNLA